MSNPRETSWPKWGAWGLAIVAFGQIAIGAVVAAYKADMAVGDWPTTHGYLVYPIGEWLGAHRDLFFVVAYRLFGWTSLGLAAATAVVFWRSGCRKPIQVLAGAVFLVILAQNVLGGVYVLGTLGDGVFVRKLYAAIVPLIGAMCVALVTVTSGPWSRQDRAETATGRWAGAKHLTQQAAATALGVYLLILLGGQLRYQPLDAEPMWFVAWVWLKLITAGFVSCLLGWLLWCVAGQYRNDLAVRRCARLLGSLFFIQVGLGAGVWVTNYALPVWFTDYVWAVEYTVIAEGTWQVVMVTSHTFVGSAMFGVAVALVLWGKRGCKNESRASEAGPLARD